MCFKLLFYKIFIAKRDSMSKKIPIGKDDLKEVIEQDYYYVDKTDIIEKLLIGKTVEFEFDDKTTYQDYSNLSNSNKILNLLLASGYLTV